MAVRRPRAFVAVSVEVSRGRSVTQTLRGRQSVAAPPLAHGHVQDDLRGTLPRCQRPATRLTPPRSNLGAYV